MFWILRSRSSESEYQIALPRKIIPWTIGDSIEQLSDLNYTPTTVDYLNLVVRYAVSYMYQSPTQRITRQIADDALSILCNPEQQGTQEMASTLICEYQLRMAFDIGASIDIMRDIIERKLDIDKQYIGIDAGTGSGITLLAQYIQARRHGIKREKIANIWIEIDPNVSVISNEFVRNLGIGSIFSVDSTEKDIYRELGRFDFYTNENIPYHENPYSKLVSRSEEGGIYIEEPFFENLYAMKKAGINLSQGEFFPQKITNKVHEIWKDEHFGWVHALCWSFKEEEFYFDPKNPKNLDNKKSVYWHQRMLAPTKILINNEWESLDKVGNKYRSVNPLDKKDTEKILLANNPLLWARWNFSRIPDINID